MASLPYNILVKEKGVAPSRSSMPMYQVFIFKNRVELFNNFFRHNMMNRFNVETKMGETHYAGIQNFMDIWAKSRYPDDTLFDSTLPMPNTKDYVWMNLEVNKSVQDNRWILNHDRSRSRKRMDLYQLDLKDKMFHDLVGSSCYVLEMRENTLNKALEKGAIQLTHQFSIKSKVNQSDIDKTDISAQRSERNFVGALEAFICVELSPIPSSIGKRSRSTSLYDDDGDDEDEDEEEDDDEEEEDEEDANVSLYSSASPTCSVKSSLSIREHPTPYRRTNPKRQSTEKQGISFFVFFS